MPVDKLFLLCPTIKTPFKHLVMEKGEPRGNFKSSFDLRKMDPKLSVRISCDGRFNNTHKMEFIDVARLGLRNVEWIVAEICEASIRPRICRFDCCVDLWGVSCVEMASRCSVSGVQKFAMEGGRWGNTFYPHRSRTRTVLIYDKIKHWRSKNDPNARLFKSDDLLCRIELQLKGRGVPYKNFADIRKYGDFELLRGVNFSDHLEIRSGLRPRDELAGLGFRGLAEQCGLQAALKRYPSFPWKNYFVSGTETLAPRVQSLIRLGVRDWLDNRIRSPRLIRETGFQSGDPSTPPKLYKAAS